MLTAIHMFTNHEHIPRASILRRVHESIGRDRPHSDTYAGAPVSIARHDDPAVPSASHHGFQSCAIAPGGAILGRT